MQTAQRILAGLTILGLAPVSLLAAEPDAFLSRLADSPLLTPRFSHLEGASTIDLTERESPAGVMPVFQAEQRRDLRRPIMTNALAIEWQHALTSAQQLSLSAQYSDQVNLDTARLAATGSGAAFSLSHQFGRDSQVAGQLFLGDEGIKSRANGYGARRYYGMVFEGRTSLWRDHTPFASLSWQRNDYEGLDGNGPAAGSALRSESISRFGAGWAWQVMPHLDLRAEAQYRLNEESLDPAEQDRLQFYFRSRYGFR